jgi:hypothetical protein
MDDNDFSNVLFTAINAKRGKKQRADVPQCTGCGETGNRPCYPTNPPHKRIMQTRAERDAELKKYR